LVWPWEILSDKIAVQGDQSRRVLGAFGAAASKIEITGQVRYDHFTAGAVNSQTRQKVRDRLGIERPYLAVVATDPGSLTHTLSQKQDDETYVVEELAGQSEWDLVFKLHPLDNGAITRNVTRDRSEIRIISNEFSAEELIAACDLWIATVSTTAVEAVIAGRPVALLNCAGGNFMSELVDLEVAGYVSKPGDIQSLVKRITTPERNEPGFSAKRETFLRDRLYRLDGNATMRVVELMRKMRNAG
jgi:CDP-glycerol glycerophosphotransferase (TagB/SpsB family)